jgi:4-amino-4-deoxy-L-arabinose transferase-like glycosyltransferase
MKKILRVYWPLILIVATTSYLFMFRLGRNILTDWDECLYGQYVKEMGATHHYLTNIWNGYLDFQKPPLYSWLVQIPVLFGRTEFNLRILNVLGALGILIVLYLFAQKYFSRRTAILSTLVLLTGEVFVIFSLRMNTDILYTLFIFVAFWLWIAQLKSKQKSSILPIVSGLFLGLAVMVKGLGSLQFILALFISLFINFNKEKFIDFIKLCVAFAIVILPWHVIAYFTYKSRFIKVYILDNIIKRSKYPIEFHKERWWFYFGLIYRELYPWIFAVLILPLYKAVTLVPVFVKNPLKKLQAEFKAHELMYIIVLTIVVPLASLTRVHTKVAWYILPVYPFLALFLGYSMNVFIERVALMLSAKNKMRRQIISVILFSIVVVFISLDALQLITHETRFSEPTQEISKRDDAIMHVRSMRSQAIEYLVPFGERMAKVVLPPEEQIDMTWVYGGHPCAVYYSDKKVNYYYETDTFEKKLGQKGKLYLIENGDLHFVEKLNPKFLYKNTDYSVFTF